MWTFPNSNNTNTIKQKSASKDSTLETETVDRFSPLLFQRLLLPPLGLSWWPCLMLDAQTKGRALAVQPPQPVATPPQPCPNTTAALQPVDRQPTGHGRLKAGRKQNVLCRTWAALVVGVIFE